jgi:hypothetical protein
VRAETAIAAHGVPLVDLIIAFPSMAVSSGAHVALQTASPELSDLEQCSPVCPGARLKVVVHETPPNPTFQSTEVPQTEDELLVILITVALRGEGPVCDAM